MVIKFQVTTFEKFSQFSRVADRSIIAGLDVADLPNWIGANNVADAVEQTVTFGKRYSFIDSKGNHSQLVAVVR